MNFLKIARVRIRTWVFWSRKWPFCKLHQNQVFEFVFINGLSLASFCFFHLFKLTFKFLQQIYVKKCPSYIWCWDSNPWPSVHESPPITTRPGLPPILVWLWVDPFVHLHLLKSSTVCSNAIAANAFSNKNNDNNNLK